MINVTKPFFPPIEEYFLLVKDIWAREWITNNGPLVEELELKLKEFLKVDHLLYLSNGTIAIQLAIKALSLKGEIITTPFSYVATTSTILWESCQPVFVDIDPQTLNIDPRRIEDAITTNTSAILATHVYGNPCDIDSIEDIARRHSLKVIYDAAHCFGTRYKGRSVFEYGDISTTSFHATKVFHTAEGGAVVTKNPELIKKISFLRNFGHNGPFEFAELGINAKNSELHAALGILNLKYVNKILERRKILSDYYDFCFNQVDLIKVSINADSEFNYAYYPVIFKNEDILLKILKALNDNLVYPRRYFYPSLTQLPYVTKISLFHTDNLSKRVLCLPLYFDLTTIDIDFISQIIIKSINSY